MDEIPYQTLLMMNAVMPDYKNMSSRGGTGPKKRMTLFEMAEAVGRGEGI